MIRATQPCRLEAQASMTGSKKTHGQTAQEPVKEGRKQTKQKQNITKHRRSRYLGLLQLPTTTTLCIMYYALLASLTLRPKPRCPKSRKVCSPFAFWPVGNAADALDRFRVPAVDDDSLVGCLTPRAPFRLGGEHGQHSGWVVSDGVSSAIPR